MSIAQDARMLARAVPDIPFIEPVPYVRLPNPAWVRFLDGPLSDADWELIERVERGEISVDQAVGGLEKGS